MKLLNWTQGLFLLRFFSGNWSVNDAKKLDQNECFRHNDIPNLENNMLSNCRTENWWKILPLNSKISVSCSSKSSPESWLITLRCKTFCAVRFSRHSWFVIQDKISKLIWFINNRIRQVNPLLIDAGGRWLCLDACCIFRRIFLFSNTLILFSELVRLY